MNVIETCTNHGGKLYALVTNGRAFWVMGRTINYSQGADVVSWHKIHPNKNVSNREFQQLAKEGMTQEDAEILFDKRLEGRAKN